jgi:CheY-like chemotaxis protein
VGIGTVSHDITGRKRMEDDLRHLAADLSEANRRKSEFLATLSHELRNPLSPLTHMLEVLKRGGHDPALRESAVETMGRQLGQLVRLVDDLLDLNRITHNRIELRKGRVELASVIHQAMEALRPAAEASGHDLQATLPREPIYLDADSVRLTQVFGNLIHNACKYTKPGGWIRVRAERRGEEAWVMVEDSGVGIPTDQLHSIFDMFAQADGSPGRSQGGLGIGLTLVKRLVQMHGGTVEARSAGPGQGSTFTVRLPIASAPSEAHAVAATPSATATAPATGRRVLVVDDNVDAASVLTLLLKMNGYESHMAHDGTSALESLDRLHPDVVLLDIGLPALNGYEVCRRVRERPSGRAAIVLALTGWGQEEDRRLSREAGFDGHLVKPVDFNALVTLMDSVAASRDSRV